MDGAWHPVGHRLVRARWRLRGAWMWPAFVVLACVDGVVGHALPVSGDSQSVIGGIVVALLLNLACVAVLARPVAGVMRLRRRDLPVAIARNYAGTALLVLVTAGFVVLGVAHAGAISHDRRAMRDAGVRAAAYIGDHAPAAYEANADRLSVFAIVDGSIYRACAPNAADTQSYCVIVNELRPLARSVVPAGSESNITLSRGTD